MHIITIFPHAMSWLKTWWRIVKNWKKIWKSYNSNNDNNNYNNTKKSPGDLSRLAVTQTPVKNLKLTLMWKTLKE